MTELEAKMCEWQMDWSARGGRDVGYMQAGRLATFSHSEVRREQGAGAHTKQSTGPCLFQVGPLSCVEGFRTFGSRAQAASWTTLDRA
jgi:hypothetical protein